MTQSQLHYCNNHLEMRPMAMKQDPFITGDYFVAIPYADYLPRLNELTDEKMAKYRQQGLEYNRTRQLRGFVGEYAFMAWLKTQVNIPITWNSGNNESSIYFDIRCGNKKIEVKTFSYEPSDCYLKVTFDDPCLKESDLVVCCTTASKEHNYCTILGWSEMADMPKGDKTDKFNPKKKDVFAKHRSLLYPIWNITQLLV